jgi:hypothetical protein
MQEIRNGEWKSEAVQGQRRWRLVGPYQTGSGCSNENRAFWVTIVNKKFWEELIAYFIFIQIEGWPRKFLIQNTASISSAITCVSIAAGTCLPKRCLPTAVSYGSTISAFRCIVTLLSPWGCSEIWNAVMLVLLMGRIYGEYRWDGFRCYFIRSFINICSGIQKFMEGIHAHTLRQQGDLIYLVFFFKIRTVG